MKNDYPRSLLARYFFNAFTVWKENPNLTLRLARIVEEECHRFNSVYDAPYDEEVVEAKPSSGKSGNSKPKTKKTPRNTITDEEIETLGQYLQKAVEKFSSAEKSADFDFLEKILTHLGFEEIDRQICEVLLLGTSYYGRYEGFLSHLMDLNDEEPLTHEILAAFIGKDSKITRDRLKFEAPLLNSGVMFYMPRDYEGDPVQGINYHLHGKIIGNIDNEELDVEAAIDRLIGKAVKPEVEWSDFDHIREKGEYAAEILKGALKENTAGINILVHGDTGTGKTEFCKVLAAHLGVPLYMVGARNDPDEDEAEDNAKSPNYQGSAAGRLADKRLVENLLGRRKIQALTMFDEMEDVIRPEQVKTEKGAHSSFFLSKLATNALLEGNGAPCLYTTNNIERFEDSTLRRFAFAIELKTPDAKTRQRVIIRTLQREGLKLTTRDVVELADKYPVPPAFYGRVIKSATIAQAASDSTAGEPESLLRNLTLGFDSICRIIDPDRGAKSPQPLENYSLGLVNAETGFQDLTRKLISAPRRDFSICLYGPSGTGKSEYLVWLAHQMEIEALLVPYSSIGSSYHSETERNIRLKFEEASDEKKFLIFDEADSLLSHRSGADYGYEVRITNEMLTAMERHPLPFGCTTNLWESMDQACLRRFIFKLEFKFLNREQATKAYEIYFGHPLPQGISLPQNITPGDFNVVKKQATVLGLLEDDRWLVGKLQSEATTKSGRTMGFRNTMLQQPTPG